MEHRTGLGWLSFMAAAIAAVYAGAIYGESLEAVVNLVTVATGVTLLLLERAWPERPTWTAWGAEEWQDLLHFFLSFGVGAAGGTALAAWLVPGPLVHLWPARLPMPLQVLVGLLIAEFFLYWQHRLMHQVPALWRFHSLHHQPRRMTFFKTTRIHAVDIGSATFLSLAPIAALGAPGVVLVWVTSWTNFAAQSQHANVRLRTPAWLNRLVCTPATHWLHHSIDKREGHSNFGMNVMLWDHVFRSYMPPPPVPEGRLGIEPDEVPAGFVAQVLSPFIVRRPQLSPR